MGNALKITDAELEVMNVIWEKAPVTSSEIVEVLTHDTDWKPNTIMTLISRLVKKDIITFKKEGKVRFYSPLVTRDQCIEEMGASFMDRFFDGSLMPMLAHFTSKQDLTPEEKAELKKLLDEE